PPTVPCLQPTSTPRTNVHTLSLHDALPILSHAGGNPILRMAQKSRGWMQRVLSRDLENSPDVTGSISGMALGLRHQTQSHSADRSEEHTSELQSLAYIVCRLLLEKKKYISS